MEIEQNIDIEKLISKFIDGTYNQSDKELLTDYIEATHNDKVLNGLLLKHWETLQEKDISIDADRLTSLKQKIQSRIFDAKSPEAEREISASRNWKFIFGRIAAVLVLPLLLASVYVAYNLGKDNGLKSSGTAVVQQIVSSPGSRVHFTLPDQTEVWLNSGSKLEFPTGIAANAQRRVKLSGQGYFEVAHDAKHPFFVETNAFTIKVLGTSFDVSCYDNDNSFSSTLEKGSISILNKKNLEIGRLVPGEKAIVEKADASVTIEKVDTELTTSWKDGKLIFRNTSLKEVTKQMERWYNCHIEVDPRLTNSDISYTATIQQETIEEVLKMIEISTHVKTKIENRNVKIWK
jgi:ferric-dicitrate binding protein FerR (iron transport regulator)